MWASPARHDVTKKDGRRAKTGDDQQARRPSSARLLMKASTASSARRVAALRVAMEQRGTRALLITNGANRRYLSGFRGSAGLLLVTSDKQYVIADFRYWESVAEQAPDWELVKIQRSIDIPSAIARLVTDVGLTHLGFESDDVTVATLNRWRDASGKTITYEPCEGIVERLRAVKDDDELATIRRALAITDDAYARLRTWLKPGMTERSVAWELEKYMREHGAEGLAFPIIVASGPNAAMPHAVTTDRPIQASETVIIDMGARVDGYCADLTRTFCLPPIPQEVRRIYEIVLAAHEEVERRMRAGMTGKEGDALARDIITEYGYGDAFGHSTGHSLGYDIHEWPSLSRQHDEPLDAGVIETVEPGIYLPGWGGVRIEDVIVVRDGPPDILTRADKSLDWSNV